MLNRRTNDQPQPREQSLPDVEQPIKLQLVTGDPVSPAQSSPDDHHLPASAQVDSARSPVHPPPASHRRGRTEEREDAIPEDEVMDVKPMAPMQTSHLNFLRGFARASGSAVGSGSAAFDAFGKRRANSSGHADPGAFGRVTIEKEFVAVSLVKKCFYLPSFSTIESTCFLLNF
jgi:hypothetical protein